MTQIDKKNWRSRTRDLMKKLGYSQKDIAIKLGISEPLFNQNLSGAKTPPDEGIKEESRIDRIAAFLGVHPAWLRYGFNPPSQRSNADEEPNFSILQIIDWHHEDSDHYDIIDMPHAHLQINPYYIAFKVYDDSMWPQTNDKQGFLSGSIVLIDTHKEYKINDIILAQIHVNKAPRLREIFKLGETTFLRAYDGRSQVLRISEYPDFKVLGVIVGYINLFI